MSRERFMLRVGKGVLTPADRHTSECLRAKGYHVGDIVHADLAKPRNPKFHRLVHAFGELVADNIDAFHGLDAHLVLKRIQLEANIGCDEIALNFPGVGPCTYRVPQSLSFQSMDEGQFTEMYRAMCRHISAKYWPDMSVEQIAEMVGIMEDSA